MGRAVLYDPAVKDTFKISRSKIDLYIQCPRCFYLNQRLGIKEPSGPGFSLNSAVDHLLKKEFDELRALGKAHPLMIENHVPAIPFTHEMMDKWRHNFTGVQYEDLEHNLLIYGAVDDIWINRDEELIVVDYKSTSTQAEITLDGKYKEGYKRQMEIYQWLLRKIGYKVNETGYFVYANARKDCDRFDCKLEFELQLLPYVGDDSWVDGVVTKIKECLDGPTVPENSPDCELCAYVEKAKEV